MKEKPLNPVHKRNAILITGATTLLVSILLEPNILSLFTTQFGVLRMVLAIITGSVLAIGISQVGEMALRSPIEPWYGRPGAPLLITIAYGMMMMEWILYQEFMKTNGSITSMEDIAHLFASLGLGLILITLLNWVSYGKCPPDPNP